MNPLKIDTLEYAVADAVATLSRSRIRKDGPFYLERPRSLLRIAEHTEYKDQVPGTGLVATATVTCESWGTTVLTLTLTNSGKSLDWLAWGNFDIVYGRSAPHPSLIGKTISKRIAPSFERSVAGFPMRYRIRNRVGR